MENEIINDAKYLGKKLKMLRHINEMTIDEVATKIQASNSFISYIEKGERKIKGLQLRKLLAVYNYPLGKFLSHILDEYIEYNYEPDAIVQKYEHHILLEGNNNATDMYLKLLRPIRSDDDSEILELYLPPGSQIPIDDNFIVKAEIRGIVIEGGLLVVIESDENNVKVGEEFSFKGSKPHYFRNPANFPAKAILIIHPPVF